MYKSKLSFIRLSVVLALLFNTYHLHSAAKEQYTFGIFPYVSPTQLVKFHTPLRIEMEKILGKPVSLVSAASFKKFIKRTKMQKYDFIMTAPHLGRLAEVRDKYQPMVHTMHSVQGVYLVKKDSPIKSLSDLKGKTITSVGRAAIITQMSMQQLKGMGLLPGKDVTFKLTKNHNSSMYAPLRGESDVSMTGTTIWGKIIKDAELKKKMRIIGKTAIAPGFMVMAKENINLNEVDKLKEVLADFHNTPVGKNYIDSVGFGRFKIAANDVMKKLDPFIQIFLKKKEVTK